MIFLNDLKTKPGLYKSKAVLVLKHSSGREIMLLKLGRLTQSNAVRANKERKVEKGSEGCESCVSTTG